MSIEIHGTHGAQHAALIDAFRENFTQRGEIGAAIALVVDGELVVDVWAGEANTGKPWQSDIRPNVWSTTKGVAATCFAMLATRGLVDYETPVAHYWPEFAAQGKGALTVAQLLSHQAGLCGFRAPAGIEAYYTTELSANMLAEMEPFWKPGSQSGYHAITIGLLATTLFRKIEGRSLRQFVAEELGSMEIGIGLDPNDLRLAATMFAPAAMNTNAIVPDMSEAQLAALANPPLDPLVPNSDAWRSADIPSANGFATARGLARLYGALATDGTIDGRQLVSASALQAATLQRFEGLDAVLSVPARWAAGYLLNVDDIYGPNASAFGHSGWGGSFAFADPDRRWGFAYVMNQMGNQLQGDPRNAALLAALYRQ
jgi:CubicO group peptidase (beta-lactamase class C family)